MASMSYLPGIARAFPISMVSNADGHGQPVALTSFPEGQAGEAFWSRDSQTVYFPHNGDLWQVAIGGGAPKAGMDDAGARIRNRSSPDGARVAFVRRSTEVAEGEVQLAISWCARWPAEASPWWRKTP